MKNCVKHVLKEKYGVQKGPLKQLMKNLRKENTTLLLLFDGYDEIGGNAHPNLFDENGLCEWPNTKAIVTTRTEYVPDESKHAEWFAPKENGNGSNQMIKQYLALFSKDQISDYVEKFCVDRQLPDEVITKYQQEI